VSNERLQGSETTQTSANAPRSGDADSMQRAPMSFLNGVGAFLLGAFACGVAYQLSQETISLIVGTMIRYTGTQLLSSDAISEISGLIGISVLIAVFFMLKRHVERSAKLR
jgi:hypothetical protein